MEKRPVKVPKRDDDPPIFEDNLEKTNMDDMFENLRLVALAQSCLYLWDSVWSVISK